MNKIILLALICAISPLSAMEKQKPEEPLHEEWQILEVSPDGWNFKNETSAPLWVAWYKSKTKRGLTLTKYFLPNKTRLAEPAVIPPEGSLFLQAPKIEASEIAELLVTRDAAMLTQTIEAGSDGKIINPELKNTVFVFGKEKFGPAKSKEEASETAFTQPAGTSLIITDKDKLPGWYFQNKAERLYCRWYAAPWDRQKRLYINPQLIPGQELIRIMTDEKLHIAFPTHSQPNSQAQLLFSLNNVTLEANIMSQDDGSLPPVILSHTQQELGPFEGTWQAYVEEGNPYLVPLNRTIKVINTTHETVYCAMYYKTMTGARKYGPSELVTVIKPQLSELIQYPLKEKGATTIIVIADESHKQLLNKLQLTTEELSSLYHRHFETVNIYEWYYYGEFLLEKNLKESPFGFRLSSLERGALQDLILKVFDITKLEGPILEEFENRFIKKDPLYMIDSDVTTANGKYSLIKDAQNLTMEHAFVSKRTEHVRQAINKLFNEELIKPGQSVPTIALVFTGGGYRAMIETIGFLKGATEEKGGNIFDCALYMAGLSGSTWAINPLVISALTPPEFSEKQHTKTEVKDWAISPLNTLATNIVRNSASYMERRFIESRYGQRHGPIGLYGHSLAEPLLSGFQLNKKTTHHITLSDLRTNLIPTKYPLPISVAIDTGKSESDRIWYEFSPYYIGTRQENGGWVDSKLFGSYFRDGTLVSPVVELPLAHYMGIWGSAFALEIGDIKKEKWGLGKAAEGAALLRNGLAWAYDYFLSLEPKEIPCAGKFAGGVIPNFNYADNKAFPRLQTSTMLCLVDGGVTKEGPHRHNFASVPILQRNPDVLIMCDAIDTPNADPQSEHLFASFEEAYRLQLPFPNMRSSAHKATLESMQKETASLFMEEGTGNPIVVYMKGKKNAHYGTFDPDASLSGSFTGTTNFNYTLEQFDLLSGLTESIFIQSKELIKQAIKAAMEGKHKKSKK